MLVSRRVQQTGLAGVQMVLNRIVEKSFLVRHVRLQGVVQDEGLSRSFLGVDSSRTRDGITIVLHGECRDEVGGRVSALRAGQASLVPAGVVPSGRTANCEVLELEWEPGILGSAIGCAQVWTLGRNTSAAASRLAGIMDGKRTEATSDAVIRLFRALVSEGVGHALDVAFSRPDPTDQRLLFAIDANLENLRGAPMMVDLESELGVCRRTLARRISTIHQEYGLTGRGRTWRELRDRYRLVVASILLSHRDVSVSGIASLVGYGSTEALHHAFSEAGLPSPAVYRRAVLRG